MKKTLLLIAFSISFLTSNAHAFPSKTIQICMASNIDERVTQVCSEFYQTAEEIDGCVIGINDIAWSVNGEIKKSKMPQALQLIYNCGMYCRDRKRRDEWSEIKTDACTKSCEKVISPRLHSLM